MKLKDILFKRLLQHASQESMPKKKDAVIGPPSFEFKPGQYKNIKLKDYASIVLDESIIQEDLAYLRKHCKGGIKIKKGMTVQAKYKRGKFVGQWYDCVLVEKVEEGWIVAWCDNDKNDTLKPIEEIRLKGSEP